VLKVLPYKDPALWLDSRQTGSSPEAGFEEIKNPQNLLDAFALVVPGQVANPSQVTVLFKVPAGAAGGYAVELYKSGESGRGKKVFDSRALGAGDTLAVGKPVRFSVKLTRETRATRSMMYLWTAEVPTENQGFRVIGTGAPSTVVIPESIAKSFPAVLTIHLTALNANGKAYSLDRVYQLTK